MLQAIQYLNGKEVKGRELRVNEARPRPDEDNLEKNRSFTKRIAHRLSDHYFQVVFKPSLNFNVFLVARQITVDPS